MGRNGYSGQWFTWCCWWKWGIDSLRPRRYRRHFTDEIFKCFFLNENVSIAIKISLKFVPKGPINNIPALVQIMAWRRPGDKPLSAPMMVSLLMHICVTRPQWVNMIKNKHCHLKILCEININETCHYFFISMLVSIMLPYTCHWSYF